jgi:hypothetical protein
MNTLYADNMQVDELWDSMCHAAISLISKALNTVDNAEVLLKIKGVVALFIQTMGVSSAFGSLAINEPYLPCG